MALPPRQLALLAALVSAAADAAAAQPTTAEAAPDSTPGVGIKISFRPSVAIVVGIFTMIFSLTFLLLMYAKFCHPSSPANPTTTAAGATSDSNTNNDTAALPPLAAGVPKPVIESLPFFRFATLRGSRQGMECSVCLARFDDADLLRLLPCCRHAFHLGCVDRWLESNASCPLCRTRVDADDAALGLKYPSSARIVFGGDAALSSARFDDDTAGTGTGTGSGRDLLDIFVERVPGPGTTGGADDATAKYMSKKEIPELDRHKHRIIVSDVVFNSRWSELNSAALLALDTEMMLRSTTSSGRFFPDSPASPDPEYSEASSKLPVPVAVPAAAAATESETTRGETERKRLLGVGATGGSAVVDLGRGGGCSSSAAADAAARMISSGVRSMSEIVSLPRLRAAARERLPEEENRYRRWLPIARRTARWFAGQSRGEEEQGLGAAEAELAVHVVAARV